MLALLKHRSGIVKSCRIPHEILHASSALSLRSNILLRDAQSALSPHNGVLPRDASYTLDPRSSVLLRDLSFAQSILYRFVTDLFALQHL